MAEGSGKGMGVGEEHLGRPEEEVVEGGLNWRGLERGIGSKWKFHNSSYEKETVGR